MQRILFLDIDGPMIPGGMFFIDPMSSHDRKFSPISVAIVNRICNQSGAKIVFNTYHNTAGGALLADSVREGIKLSYIHEFGPMTLYPHGIRGVTSMDMHDRMAAITQWQEVNGEADWIAFDDSKFTTDERLGLVDFDTGISPKHYDLAANRWNLKPFLIF